MATACGRTDPITVPQSSTSSDETDPTDPTDSTTEAPSETESSSLDTFDDSTTEIDDSSSTLIDPTVPGFCGDGVVNPGEQCDPGEFEIGPGLACLPGCVDNVCGDGDQGPFEECDPGDALIGPGQACLPGCVENVCGDGDRGPDEQCDDGNNDNSDGCRNDCVLGTCNDGNVDEGEQCDDGNFDNNDACLNDCSFASCGDGFIRDGFEQCDDEDNNSPSGFCTPICTLNVCGDGFQRFDEPCDPGEDEIGPGQFCLDGCVLNECGDGDRWAGEACDDGNDDNTDACVNCLDAQCGDGFVFAEQEQCDDGDFDDLDACHNDCSFHRVTKVALGGNHTCALFDSQNVMCWGNGNNGRTGHGNEENIGDDEFPWVAGFLDAGGPVVDVVTGIGHTCLAYESGGIRCFGRALEGQLGYGNVEDLGDDEVPADIDIVPLGAPVLRLDSRGGSFHTCAQLDTLETVCWGQQTFFQLGLPGVLENIGDDEPASAGGPVSLLNGGESLLGYALGGQHSCAVLDNGVVRCWGEASSGALGYGNTNDIGDAETPASAASVPGISGATAVTAGFFHTCALGMENADGPQVKCWGRGAAGRLGYGNTISIGASTTPADHPTLDLGSTASPRAIAAGVAHTCVVMTDDTVRCWGANSVGQLGYGNTDSIGDDETAGAGGAVNVGGPVESLAADGNHTCAIMQANGAIRCWGQGGDGRLGYGNLANIGDDEPPASAGDLQLFP